MMGPTAGQPQATPWERKVIPDLESIDEVGAVTATYLQGLN